MDSLRADLHIRLERIGLDGYDLDREIPIDWISELLGTETSFSPSGDGHLRVHLDRVAQVVQVHGRLHVELLAPCVRCLEPTSLVLNAPLRMALFPRGQDPEVGDAGEIQDDDLGVASYEHHVIDLLQIIHDEIFLELPASPICTEGCAGLCPFCGRNRNLEAPCSCAVETEDSRWQALGHLSIRQQS